MTVALQSGYRKVYALDAVVPKMKSSIWLCIYVIERSGQSTAMENEWILTRTFDPSKVHDGCRAKSR
jgi:hypothetical protein